VPIAPTETAAATPKLHAESCSSQAISVDNSTTASAPLADSGGADSALCGEDGRDLTEIGAVCDRNGTCEVTAKKGVPRSHGGDGRFPTHWGNPPHRQTRDLVKWPGGFGRGSGTVRKWIIERMAADGMDTGAGKSNDNGNNAAATGGADDGDDVQERGGGAPGKGEAHGGDPRGKKRRGKKKRGGGGKFAGSTDAVPWLKTRADFDAALREHKDELVVLDLTASWCSVCEKMTPSFDRLAAERINGAHLFKVDVDTNQEVAMYCGAESLPLFVFFRGGKRVADIVGRKESALRKQIIKLAAGK